MGSSQFYTRYFLPDKPGSALDNPALFRRKIKASTVMEVIVAMTIMLIVFSIAMTIVANVWRLPLSVRKVQAAAKLQVILARQENKKTLDDQFFTEEDMRIEMIITPFPENTRVLRITLTAYDLGQQPIAKLNKIITRP